LTTSPEQDAATARPGRRAYIDLARGVAVLLMIEAHTMDAWTRASDRQTLAFRNATILGGFAAPLFLFLAGLALVLAAERAAEKTGKRAAAVDAICRRGLEIFILAFLFRLQAFIISPGGPLVSLFRVDILNIMGPAIVLAGILWALGRTTAARAALFALVACAIALATPIVRSAAWVNGAPIWAQWYLRPTADYTIFTLLPWTGFVFAGSAVGVLIAAAHDWRSERRLQVLLAFAGAALIGVGLLTAARPTIYRASSFWTSSPTWFAIRAGVLLLALSVMYLIGALAAYANLRLKPLELLGRHSLFVYWIHIELVYGYASTWWLRRLPAWGSALACVAFIVLMYGAVRVWSASPRRLPSREKRAPGYGVALNLPIQEAL
jgi:uncharacterized membrane protein